MAGASLIDDALKLLKRGKKTKSFGRLTKPDAPGIGGQRPNYMQVAETDYNSYNISSREFERVKRDPTHKPVRWDKEPNAATYNNLDAQDTERYAKYAQFEQTRRDLSPSTLKSEEGLSGVYNPKHMVIKNTEEAMNAFADVKRKLEEKANYFKAQEARLIKDRDAGLPLLREGGRPAGNQKKAYEEAIDRARRTANDYATTAPEPVVADWLDELAKPGYRAALDKPGGKISGQGPLKGKLDELIEQHHGFPNQEAADMMKQTAFVNEVFKLNVWQYIAQEYRTGLGRSRSNMWNIPATVHRGEKVGLHAWLTQMGFDDYWKKRLAANPNMTQQEIMNAVDQYFDEVFFPSLVKVENLILGQKVKHKWKGMRLPEEVLKDAKVRLVQLEEGIRQAEAPKFEDVRDLEGFGTQEQRTALDRRVDEIVESDLNLRENRNLIEESDQLSTDTPWNNYGTIT